MLPNRICITLQLEIFEILCMRKFIISLLVLIFPVGVAVAQTSGRCAVEGVLQDSLTGQPEGYATVRLMLPDSKNPVSTALSDAKGNFKLTVAKPGTYQLICSSIGKKSIMRSVTLGKDAVQMGTLKMGTDNLLGEVKVKAQRPLVKSEVDKLTYSIADDPDAQTNSLLEMLRKVPLVTVDGEDNIKVNGNANFKVYVNGKPNQMMSSNPSLIFKSYPASAIKKIEVITNPGAKYDAEGVAGVLNIITNTDTSINGYSLTPSLRVDNSSTMGSIFGMTQIGKFTMSVHYGAGYFYQPTSKTWSEREVFAETVNHLLRSDGRATPRGMFQFGNMDGSYEFSTHDLLSFSAGIHGYGGKQNSDVDNVMRNTAGNTVYSYHQHMHTRQSQPNINASADYQHTFKEDQTLTFSYQLNTLPGYTKNTTTYTNLQNIPFTLTDLYMDSKTHRYEHTGQLDFTTPLWKIHKISTGVKYIYRINKSDNEEDNRTAGSEDPFTYNDEHSLRYRQRGDIAAAYLEYNLKLKNLSAMAGARYENYHIDVTYPDGKRDGFKTDLGDLIPSISLGYNLSPTQMLKMSYNMRIQRPDIAALSPYVTRSTPEQMAYGNPNLKSARAHNIDLSYNNFSTKFSLNTTLSYSFSNNGLTSYSFMDNQNILNTTSDNFLHSKGLNLNVYMNWMILSGTSLNLNGGGSYQDLKVKRMQDHNSGFQAFCWGGITQQLPAKLKAELWMGGNTRETQLQGKGPGFLFYSLNLSREFMKENRLRISLRAGNFLGRYHNFSSETETSTFRSTSDTRVDLLRLGIGISYRLGSLNASVKKTAHRIENDDVQQTQGKTDQQTGTQQGVVNGN